jgi:hypothetical protein
LSYAINSERKAEEINWLGKDFLVVGKKEDVK